MSAFLDSSRDRTVKELLLFVILMECSTQQISMLDGRFKHTAKSWIKNLKTVANTTMAEIYKQLSIDSEFALGELYDYMYMNMRHVSEMEVENMGVMSSIIKTLVEKQEKAKAAGVTLEEYLKQNPIKL